MYNQQNPRMRSEVRTYDAITDRTGRVVPNRCAGRALQMIDATGLTYSEMGFTNATMRTPGLNRNLVVKYKCMSDINNQNIVPSMKDPSNEFMTCEGFTVLDGSQFKPSYTDASCLPSALGDSLKSPWYWDTVASNKRRTSQGFYTIDGQYVVYKL